MKKRRNKKYNIQKKANSLLSGAIMSWKVVDPLSECSVIHSFTQVSHKNPLLALMKKEITDCFMRVKDKRRLRYHVDVIIHFIDDHGVKYTRDNQMLIEGFISDADQHYYSIVENIFSESNMAHYKITEIKITVLGAGNLNINDFERCQNE